MVNYACRSLRWPVGRARLVTATAAACRSPALTLTSLYSATRQFGQLQRGTLQGFSTMNKLLGTSKCPALSIALLPRPGAPRQLGKTAYFSTAALKLRTSIAFPPSGFSLPASARRTSLYQRVYRHPAVMACFSMASTATHISALSIQLNGMSISTRKGKPAFSFAAAHNTKRRQVGSRAYSHRYHPYQRTLPLKSDSHLKVSYRGTLRRPSDSLAAFPPLDDSSGPPTDAQCFPSVSTDEPRSSSGPMARPLSTIRPHAPLAIGWTRPSRSACRNINLRPMSACGFASLSNAYRRHRRTNVLEFFGTTGFLPLPPPRKYLQISPGCPRSRKGQARNFSVPASTPCTASGKKKGKHPGWKFPKSFQIFLPGPHPGQGQARNFSVPTGTPSAAPGNKSFTYSVAASYIAKGRHFRPSVHVFQFNPYHHVQPPKPQAKALRPESGQDAFFVSRLGADPSDVALGVADGVGGWSDSGVDSADVSHALCSYMAAKAHNGETPSLTARQLLTQGYEDVCHDPKIVAGGTTATVALLKKNGTLEVANLGDSGYILLRLNGVYAASVPQIHAFNTPYQLSVVPPSVLRRASMFGGGPLMDQPRDAEVTHHDLRHGDVLILASDGVWDNLYTTNILQIVSRVMQENGAWTSSADGVEAAKDLKEMTKIPDHQPSVLKRSQDPVALQSVLATQIVAAAKSASKDKNYESPFVKEVRKYYPHDPYSGGKVDDICVVVAVVSEVPEAAGSEA